MKILITLLIGFCTLFNLQAQYTLTANDVNFEDGAIKEFYNETEKNIIIPATINGETVTTIEASVFSTKGLTAVVIPNTVTSIGEHAFEDNEIASLVLSNSLTEIKTETFRNNKLTSVTIPNSVETIGSLSFYLNKLTSLTIGNSVVSIDHNAFAQNLLTFVTIPSSVTILARRSFQYNPIVRSTLYLPPTLEIIGADAFSIPITLPASGDGYYWESGLGKGYENGELVPSLISYVRKVVTCAITYHYDGGTGLSQALFGVQKTYNLKLAYKDNYNFEGWFTEPSFINEVSQVVTGPSPTIDLYAKYSPKSWNIYYYNLNGVETTNPSSYTVESNITLADATKENHSFSGWYTEASFTNQLTKIENRSTGNLYLYAKFSTLVHIPDANFKAALLANASINTNGDNEIQTEEAEAFTGEIYVRRKNIDDLTGIEAFINATGINCSFNNLTSLDVSQNTKLIELNCSYNDFENLTLTNTKLESLDCSSSNIDVLSIEAATALTYIKAIKNNLTTLDVSNNTALEELWLYENNLTALTLGNLPVLNHIKIQTNQLVTIDLSGAPALTDLYGNGNLLEEIDLSQNTALELVYLYDNQLQTLDFSTHEELSKVDVSNNLLTQLNIANNNNGDIRTFRITDNPALVCVTVDDATVSTTDWTDKDPQTSYSTDCSPVLATTKVNKENISFSPNPVVNILSITTDGSTLTKLTIANLSGRVIESFTENTTQIDLSNYASGVYILQAESEAGIQIQRFIKE